MKRYLLSFCLIIIYTLNTQAQNRQLHGVYKMDTDKTHTLWLFVDGYSSMIHYTDKQYLSTTGGPFTFNGDAISVQTEYNDIDSASVGKTMNYPLKWEGENLKDNSGNIWVKQPNKPNALDGLWRITGRQQNGEMSTMPRGDRKTIKLLVDGHFQWIAINPAQHGFYGTGGGQYSFKNNKYSEHLLFFSRDNTRVGSSLQFDGEIKDGKWHHTGMSSKGDDIHEIWSKETE
ncbi:hypothetical protein DC487_01980 [Sphingobacterium corticibacter]|uniref:Membrane or secreted protein n=2 Tax=Sphingobacterium corticibacter TaxID=2171749 RepID=A0A2T8HLX1_9SPHI|nr:hypothetical protein DC487_01980 [Sphingobacterium corticibacter]